MSLVLGVLSLTTTPRRNTTLRYFIALCASTALWCFSYFGALNAVGLTDVALTEPNGAAYLLLLGVALGAAATPTYWFLFAASFARRNEWIRGWRTVLVHVPLAYTFIVAATNPWHRLFITGDGYGPLAIPHQLGTLVLVTSGIVLIVGTAWRTGTHAGRKQAMVLGAACSVPFAGGILWGLRHALGIGIPINPTPVLFLVLNIALAWELVRTGLADIVPYAALAAFDSISDAGLALDTDGTIAAANAAARDLLPTCRPGVPLSEAAPDLAQAVSPCLSAGSDYTGFDVTLHDRVYWGRARPMRDRHASVMGHILLLTDVTEVRMTQTRLVELERAAMAEGL